MIQLIDTHAHLDSLDDLDAALERARAANVSAVVAVGENKAANEKNLAIARRVTRPRIFLGLGLHPGRIQAGTLDDECVFIEEHISEAQAVGEIGLDFWYPWARKDTENKNRQRAVYRRLLELAVTHHLPALIHTRGTWREAFETARETGLSKAVFHWYSGPLDVLEDILAQGYYISAAPSVAYSPESRRAVEAAPLDQLLAETDSPVYYRHPDGGFQAEPKDVFRTARDIALLKQRDMAEVAGILNRNAEKIFGHCGLGD